MKESILDVLMYLFEHYFEDEVVLGDEQDVVKHELVKEGFQQNTVDKAFTWLEGLAPPDAPGHELDPRGGGIRAFRHFSKEEYARLDVECRGFLLFLEHIGVIEPDQRELVIAQAMALESDEVDLEQLKWVVQMVLFNRPAKDASYGWLEDLVFAEASGQLH